MNDYIGLVAPETAADFTALCGVCSYDFLEGSSFFNSSITL